MAEILHKDLIGEDIHELRVTIATTSPNFVPLFVGQGYYDSSAKKFYIAQATSSVSDWITTDIPPFLSFLDTRTISWTSSTVGNQTIYSANVEEAELILTSLNITDFSNAVLTLSEIVSLLGNEHKRLLLRTGSETNPGDWAPISQNGLEIDENAQKIKLSQNLSAIGNPSFEEVTLTIKSTTPLLTFSVGGTPTAASMFLNSSNGVILRGYAGSTSSFTFQNEFGTDVLSNPAATNQLVAPSLAAGIAAPAIVHADSNGLLSASKIVNADVDAAAAIDGTKVSPDFGSQNIQTTGSVLTDTIESSTNDIGILAGNDNKTISIGTGSGYNTVNIGGANTTVNIQGAVYTTPIEYVSSDKNIVVNFNAVGQSSPDSGLYVQEEHDGVKTDLTDAVWQSGITVRYLVNPLGNGVDGLAAGEFIRITGFVNSENNGTYKVLTVDSAYVDVLNSERTNSTKDETGVAALGARLLLNGYVHVGSTRMSWEVKAPAHNGIIELKPQSVAKTLLITSNSSNDVTANFNTNLTVDQDLQKAASVEFSNLKISSLSTGIAHLNSSGNLTSSLITDSDVSGTAAISGTKVSPDFGSQSVTTTAVKVTGTEPVGGANIFSSATYGLILKGISTPIGWQFKFVSNLNVDLVKIDKFGNLSAQADISSDNGNIIVSNNSNSLRFLTADYLYYTAIKGASSLSNNLTFTLPNSAGTSGQFLQTDGAGVLSWGTASGGSGVLAHPTTDSTYEAGAFNPSMTGTQNTAIGSLALGAVTSGSFNTALGTSAGSNIAAGTGNTLLGVNTGTSITNGSDNILIGSSVGTSITTAVSNIGIGNAAIGGAITAEKNVSVGKASLLFMTTGTNNVAVGEEAGLYYSSASSNNTAINSAGPASSTQLSGTVAIGRDSSGASAVVAANNDFVLGTANHKYKMLGAFQTPVILGPIGTSANNGGIIQFKELSANGSNFVGLRAPDSIASDVTWTLPSADGTNGQVLSTNGTGTLSWTTPSAGSVSGSSIVGPIYSRASGSATKIYGKVASDALTTRAISTWSVGTTWSTTSNANAICWSPELGIFVSVGSIGTLIRASTSHDGVTWTTRTTPESNTFNSVCWSPELGLFCAVSSTGTNRVMTSPDGINWTARAATTATSWRAVCWSPELALFVAFSGTGSVMMYSSNGITWTAGTGLATGVYSAVCWSAELGIFVAIGQGTVATSSNGTSWTETTLPANTIIAITKGGVVWSPELGLFVAVSDNTTSGLIATSTNGTTWTARTAPAAVAWASVAWSPELGVFCATATTGTGTRIATSVDGITWATRTNPVDNAWPGICWSPELGIFCSISSTGAINNGAMVSRDVGIYRERKVVPKYFYRAAQASEATKALKTFTSRASATLDTSVWKGACWSPELNIFVAVSTTTNLVATSPDGIIWTARTAASALLWESVCWSAEKNLFVAVSSSASVSSIMTSPDGITWTTRTQTTATSLYSICWSPDLTLFVAVGQNKVITSPDGITWTDRTAAANRQWWTVTWSPELGLFCAGSVSIGLTSNIMISTNGTTWTSISSVDTANVVSICWAPELALFCASTGNTASNHFIVSSNGSTWTGVSVPGVTTTAFDTQLCWSSELKTFVSTTGSTVYGSVDGLNWISKGTVTNNVWQVKLWSAELNMFLFLSTDATNRSFVSRKANILNEILNLRTSRLY